MGEIAQRPAHRPSSYSEAVTAELCERIADSDYGLEQVCEAEDMPSRATVYRWLEAHEEFREAYARAKDCQAHTQAGRAVRDALEAGDAQLGRLRYDARRWHASKLAPRVYGDRQTTEHTGGPRTLMIVTGVPPVIPLIDGECSEDDGDGEEVFARSNTVDAPDCSRETLPMRSDDAAAQAGAGGVHHGGGAALRLVGEVLTPDTQSPHNGQASSRKPTKARHDRRRHRED